MRLAPRLVLAFGLLVLLSVAGLGYYLREDRRGTETSRFDREVSSACERVSFEVVRQLTADLKLLSGACQSGELVDRTLLAIEASDLDGRRAGLSALVPRQREAFDLDELVLATDRGDLLGADPRALFALTRPEVEAMVRADATMFSKQGTEAMRLKCGKQGASGRTVALVGTRHLRPLIERAGRTANVTVSISSKPPSTASLAQAECHIATPDGAAIPITVSKSRRELYESLAQIDKTVLVAGLVSLGVALILAVIVAGTISRPLAKLAQATQRVAQGDAKPVAVEGAREIADVAQSYNQMIADLAVMRRRLAASNRVAAWREVARRVAHEVKNPLAPIRAAIETLRRLRARDDPAFDEYFDEASRTVLEEVHRIAGIVTEFTRFARLAPPRPSVIDLADVADHVTGLLRPSGDGAIVEVHAESRPMHARADRDQVIQVLTNLVSNALDALRETDGGRVDVRLEADDTEGYVRVTVEDNGPGIPEDMAQRLFEPYATTKAHGTGLGLAIAQRIATEHGGELTCIFPQDSEARGARFRLRLPIDGPAPSLRGGGQTTGEIG
jgi:two-component system nitrogen regulation sensor histidine kinase NtrY